jgi:hypothetical protein
LMNVEACGICKTKKPNILSNLKTFWEWNYKIVFL